MFNSQTKENKIIIYVLSTDDNLSEYGEMRRKKAKGLAKTKSSLEELQLPDGWVVSGGLREILRQARRSNAGRHLWMTLKVSSKFDVKKENLSNPNSFRSVHYLNNKNGCAINESSGSLIFQSYWNSFNMIDIRNW